MDAMFFCDLNRDVLEIGCNFWHSTLQPCLVPTIYWAIVFNSDA